MNVGGGWPTLVYEASSSACEIFIMGKQYEKYLQAWESKVASSVYKVHVDSNCNKLRQNLQTRAFAFDAKVDHSKHYPTLT